MGQLQGSPQVAAAPAKPYRDLFLISFTILFLELASIRFFGSTVVFLTFFTNVVLMACFLGMSVGLLTATRKQNFVRIVIPMCLVSVGLAWGVLLFHDRSGWFSFQVGSQQSPQQIYFGAEYAAADPSRFLVPIEVVAAVFYVLIALTFLGLGQVMGRCFAAIDDRIRAYTVDMLGSISGIVLFSVLSYFQVPPVIWFAVALLCCIHFVRPLGLWQIGSALASLVVVGMYSLGVGARGEVSWSPYYKIVYHPEIGTIWTNNIGHQQMMRVPGGGDDTYILPHFLARDAANRTFDDVLIIGAGSGNDVAAALLAGAKHVDAVEIDPVIYKLGRAHHPNRAYADPRVTVHLDDGRSFLRHTERKYDLVVYALVDSLVLHSGYSSLRLESFLFTDQSMHDVRRVLKPGGMFAMYNLFRQGWVVGRLVSMVRDAIGDPVVISLPYHAEIRASDSQSNTMTVILAGASAPGSTGQPIIDAIRTMLSSEEAAETPMTGSWRAAGIRTSKVDVSGSGPVPTDSWPLLYLRQRYVPWLNIRGVVIITIVSVLMLLLFAPRRGFRFNWTMFFLGAGFMLLETKGVVHMALLFGGTWIVNSIVFTAILIMILCANLFVLKLQPRRLAPYFVLLSVALIANALIPMSRFLSLPGVARTVISCAVVFLPILFAGVIFAALFRDSADPAADFGSNVAGIILGGMCEYLSLVLGFDHLLIVALVLYLLAFAFLGRQRVPWVAAPA